MGLCFSKSSSTHEISISSSDSPPPQYQPLPKNTRYAPPVRPPSQPTPPPPHDSRFGSILRRPCVDVNSVYDLGKELGRGQFGITRICTDKRTGLKYGCKSISKRKLINDKDIGDVRREISILQHLTGQPNIVEFRGAYEDTNNVHVVMELCSGGELFDRIIAKGSYSEKEAASIGRQIVNVVHVCHFMGVMHRDLKPENFLLVSRDEASPLKAIDFGLSVFIEKDNRYKDMVGSAYYIAPEVLHENYGKEIDVWSAGIILYILLCGVPPFWAETEQGIFKAILDGHLDLQSSPWPSISPSAKDLIKKMLTRDPKKRITAAEALEHPWLKVDGEASDNPIDSAVLIRMKQFRAMNMMKKLALKVIAENLSTEEINGLKQMFNNMDTDGSGTITLEELKVGLNKLGSKLSEEEIRQLMEATDVDNNGTIDYLEFITATMHRHRLEKEENLFKAFQYFDKDGSGFITRDELKQAMTEYGVGDDASIDEVIADVDIDKVAHNIKAGDKVNCTISDLQPLMAEPEDIPLDIVYEDEHLLVVNKPAHMVVHPAPGNPSGTLVNGILHHCRLPTIASKDQEDDSDEEDLCFSTDRMSVRPGIVHRLDKGTSGLLVVAKNEHAHAHLSEQFKQHSIQKVYISITSGMPSQPAGRVEIPIGRDLNNRIRMAAMPGSSTRGLARHAASRYKVIEILAGGGSALVEWRLETGRTHQIRAHAKYLGIPLLGDEVYGGTKSMAMSLLRPRAPPCYYDQLSKLVSELERPCLHALALGFKHPHTGDNINFSCPPPSDFTEILSQLRKIGAEKVLSC